MCDDKTKMEARLNLLVLTYAFRDLSMNNITGPLPDWTNVSVYSV